MDKYMGTNENGIEELYEKLNGKTVLVTGATGLIGRKLCVTLSEYGTKVMAVVRNLEKAIKYFAGTKNIEIVLSDVTDLDITDRKIDYIVHAAANTSSKAFVQDPVGVAMTSIHGTERILELAKRCDVKKIVYLSTMEVYGAPTTDEKIDELHASNLDTMSPRSSYPESKRVCENLCASYYSQYGVPAIVLRLTQTFGPGVEYNDGRVFAEFARCAIEGRNIVLHTKGETKRNYLYIDDAVSAIIIAMLRGKAGEAYNVANEATYCSIYEMAKLVAEKCADGKIDVVIDEGSNAQSFGYAPVLHMNLSTQKINELGWKPTVGLEEMFKRMIEWMDSLWKEM